MVNKSTNYCIDVVILYSLLHQFRPFNAKSNEMIEEASWNWHNASLKMTYDDCFHCVSEVVRWIVEFPCRFAASVLVCTAVKRLMVNTPDTEHTTSRICRGWYFTKFAVSYCSNKRQRPTPTRPPLKPRPSTPSVQQAIDFASSEAFLDFPVWSSILDVTLHL